MSPAANDFSAVHMANERAYASQTFAYTPPVGSVPGDPVAGLKGDFRDEPEEVDLGEGEMSIRTGGLRLGVRAGQLPVGVEIEIDGAVVFDGGAVYRVVDIDAVNGHVWVSLHEAE